MTVCNAGTRVFCIRSTDIESNRLFVFGGGRYVGDEEPDWAKDEGLPAGWKNPKIVLDTGKVVWGCECWWGEEISTKKRYPEGTGPGQWEYVLVEPALPQPATT